MIKKALFSLSLGGLLFGAAITLVLPASAEDALGQVTNVRVKKTARTAMVRWDAVEGAEKYEVKLMDEGQTQILKTATVKRLRKTFMKLLPGETYTVQVSAMAGEEVGLASDIVTFKTTPRRLAIEDFQFIPEGIVIKKGTTVRWLNRDMTPHTVTSDDGLFESGTIEEGGIFKHTFDEVGSFNYHCAFHTEMQGTILVQE